VHKRINPCSTLHCIVLVAVLLVMFPSAPWAGWLQHGKERRGNEPERIASPVVNTGSGEFLGLYGGIASAYSLAGERQGARVVVLPGGYLLPVLDAGEIATFPVAYFSGSDCTGNEYVPATGDRPGLIPMHGMVFRSLASKLLVYTPKRAVSSRHKIQSRMKMLGDGSVRCEQSGEQLLLLQVEPHRPDETGLKEPFAPGPVVLETAVRRLQADRPRSWADAGLTGEGVDSGVNGEQDASVQECSPGCFTNVLGNGSCDIDCYVEACFYDAGDCAEVDPAELQQQLANICSPGCHPEDVGDGFCDPVCNNESCNFDGNDCVQNRP